LNTVSETFPDIQSTPAILERRDGVASVALMVEGAVLVADRLIVHGWAVGKLELELCANGEALEAQVLRYRRDDVLREFALSADAPEPGFVLLAAVDPAPSDVALRWKSDLSSAVHRAALSVKRQVDPGWLASLGLGASCVVPRLADDAKWLAQVVGSLSTQPSPAAAADGRIEYAGTLGALGAAVFGWGVSRPGSELWLFDESGHGERLSAAVRFDRADVRDQFAQKYGNECLDSGFLLRWPAPPGGGAKLKLAAVGPDSVRVVHTGVWQHARLDPDALAKLRNLALVSGKPALKSLAEAAVDLQSTPAIFARDKGSPSLALMVDSAVLLAGRLVVHGWALGELRLQLRANGAPVKAERLRYRRDDVMRELGLPAEAGELGFVLLAQLGRAADEIELRWHADIAEADGSAVLRVKKQVDEHFLPSLGHGASKLVPLLAHDAEWLARVVAALAVVPSGAADGHIECADSLGALGGFVSGWALAQPGTELWLFDDAGHGERLAAATRFDRADIHKFAQKYGHDCADAGFLMRWREEVSSGSSLKLVAVGASGVRVVHAAAWEQASLDPGAFTKRTLAIPTSVERFQERMLRHDGVLIERLLAAREKELESLPVEVWSFGAAPAAAQISVIVPLHAGADLVEHQLLEFCADPDFQGAVELIYVIDDARVLPLKNRAEGLWKSYGVPFKLLWGNAQRGFAGANNLGVRKARADVLLFLNSGVFPKRPGWVSALRRTLLDHPDFAAVAPRLLLPDGGIQHAGLAFAYDEGLGVWAHQHPMAGLDPGVDSRRGLVEQVAVSAACVAVRRDAFELVGGFDGGFLFGGFADSDLCLKLKHNDFRVGYLPEVELVHLERQPAAPPADPAFQRKVMLFNAGRHSRKWADYFSASKMSQ
jgi:GT2 family glycosyltransferase